MKTNCLRCSKEYDTTKGYCRTCYEKALFKGQCLNIAGNILKDTYNPEHPSFLENLFKLARQIYEQGSGEKVDEKKKFLKW